jgi:phenylacetate-coenzyme A ligase PaaK-like adenylate-forming protein
MGRVVQRPLESHDSWSRDEIKVLRRQKLEEIINYAIERSPFYRDRYRFIPAPWSRRLRDLPVVTRDELMADFDCWVTDPRLQQADLQEHSSISSVTTTTSGGSECSRPAAARYARYLRLRSPRVEHSRRPNR